MASLAKKAPSAGANDKLVGKGEFIWYLISVFFFTNMTGMIGSFRSANLVDVVELTDSQMSLFNIMTSVIPFILNFFIVMYIDGRKIGKHGKFRPLVMIAAVPMGILLFMNFWIPKELSGAFLMVYVITVGVLWGIMNIFGNSINSVAVVMTPN